MRPGGSEVGPRKAAEGRRTPGRFARSYRPMHKYGCHNGLRRQFPKSVFITFVFGVRVDPSLFWKKLRHQLLETFFVKPGLFAKLGKSLGNLSRRE